VGQRRRAARAQPGAALAAQAPILAGKLAGPAEIVVLQAVPAGDPAKGQL